MLPFVAYYSFGYNIWRTEVPTVDGLNEFFQANAAQMWIVLACLVFLVEAWVIVLTWRLFRGRVSAAQVPPDTTVANTAAHDSIAQLQDQMYYSLQRVGVVRFNPFEDTGGDQSFALVLADAFGNGVVMSSLYRRGDSRIFAKPLTQWQSSYALSTEEQQAIERARGDEQPELTETPA